MDWNLSKDYRTIQETVREIAQEELAPRAAEVDKTYSFVWEGLKKRFKSLRFQVQEFKDLELLNL